MDSNTTMYFSIALAVALIPALTISYMAKFNTSLIPSMLAEKMERFSTNNTATIMSFIIPLLYGFILLPIYLIYMVGSSLAAQTDAREGLQASLFLTCIFSGLVGVGRLWAEGWWFTPEIDPRKHFAESLGLTSDDYYSAPLETFVLVAGLICGVSGLGCIMAYTLMKDFDYVGVSAVFACLSALPVLSLVLDRASSEPGAEMPDFTALLEDKLLAAAPKDGALDDDEPDTTDLGGAPATAVRDQESVKAEGEEQPSCTFPPKWCTDAARANRKARVWAFSISILLCYAIITWCRSKTVPGLGFAQVSAILVMDFVLYITFVHKPDPNSTGWTSLLTPTISQSLHLTYSDVCRASVLIVAARVSPVSFGEDKWFLGHALLFFFLATVIVRKLTSVILGRPSAAATARQHQFELLHHHLSDKAMSSSAKASFASHTIDMPKLKSLVLALGVLTFAFVVELVVVAVPRFNDTLSTKDFAVCSTCRPRRQSLWGLGALIMVLVEAFGFYVLNWSERRAQRSGEGPVGAGSFVTGGRSLGFALQVDPIEAGVLWALTIGLFGYFSFLIDSAWLVITTCMCPLMIASAAWGYDAWAVSDYSIALWARDSGGGGGGGGGEDEDEDEGGAPAGEQTDEQENTSTELAVRADGRDGLRPSAGEAVLGADLAPDVAPAARSTDTRSACLAPSNPLGSLAVTVQAAICFFLATLVWALLLFICFAERFKWIAWTMAAGVVCLTLTYAAYVHHFNTQRVGVFFRVSTGSWLAVLFTWGLGTWQVAGEGAYDYFAVSILFVCVTYPALVILAYAVLDLSVDNDWKLRRPVQVTHGSVTHTELRIHRPTVAAFSMAGLLFAGFGIGLVSVGGAVAGAILLFGIVAVAMMVGGFVEFRRRRYHLTKPLRFLLAALVVLIVLCGVVAALTYTGDGRGALGFSTGWLGMALCVALCSLSIDARARAEHDKLWGGDLVFPIFKLDQWGLPQHAEGATLAALVSMSMISVWGFAASFLLSTGYQYAGLWIGAVALVSVYVYARLKVAKERLYRVELLRLIQPDDAKATLREAYEAAFKAYQAIADRSKLTPAPIEGRAGDEEDPVLDEGGKGDEGEEGKEGERVAKSGEAGPVGVKGLAVARRQLSLRQRLILDDRGLEGEWSQSVRWSDAHLDDGVTKSMLAMGRDIDKTRLALKAKIGETTAHGFSLEGFSAKSRFSANPLAVFLSGITQLRCCKACVKAPEPGSESARKLEERRNRDAEELEVAHTNAAELMELHREVRGQVLAFHGFCGHLSLEISTKVSAAHAQREAELRDFLRTLALEDPAASALAERDIASLAPEERALVDRAWDHYRHEKQRKKEEQERKRAEEEEGARKRRAEAAKARAEERRRREEARRRREADRKAQEEAEAARLAEEEAKVRKEMAEAARRAQEQMEAEERAKADAMAAEARRELERIAKERRRQAEIEESHKKIKSDDIDKARSEGYSDMVDAVDMEEILVNAAAAEDGKFTDSWRELGQNVRRQPDEWQRESVMNPKFELNKDGFDASDIHQGQLGDCWFLSAIACLATNQKLLERILVRHDKAKGFFVVQFYRNGIWKEVAIDDYFPVKRLGYGVGFGGYFGAGDGDDDASNYRHVFAHSQNRNEVWVQVVEKAYAKLHGSYGSLDGGVVTDGLVDMTGGTADTINLAKAEEDGSLYDGRTWKALLALHDQGHLIGAGSHSGSDSETSDAGIVQGHAYSVLRVVEVDGLQLLKLRNPWGEGGEWNGKFSDRDRDSWTQRLKAKLDYRDADDGEFWIQWTDFVGQFASIYICRVLDEANWTRAQEFGNWVRGVSAGGCTNYRETYGLNPQFLLTVTDEPLDLIITLSIDDSRMEGEEDNEVAEAAIGFSVYRNETSGGGNMNLSPYVRKAVGSKGYVRGLREVFVEHTLAPGNYNILCNTFKPDIEAHFCLRVYCMRRPDVGGTVLLTKNGAAHAVLDNSTRALAASQRSGGGWG